MIYRVAAVMLLLAAVITVNAQKLTVESFEANPFDLTAVTKPVLDFNNNPCGLVKVRLAVAGAKFGGNIIEPVEYDLGEYNVYMTEGLHLMIVRGPGFVPLSLDFRDYGICSQRYPHLSCRGYGLFAEERFGGSSRRKEGHQRFFGVGDGSGNG